MGILRTKKPLKLCFTPLNMLNHSDLKVCYLNTRSLHIKHSKHIEDVRKDVNYSSTDILVFSATRFSPLDPDDIYNINGYMLFRNSSSDSSGSGRPYGGTAVYSWVPLRDGYPFAHNIDGIEFTIIKTERHLDLTIIALYRFPQVPIPRLLSGLRTILVIIIIIFICIRFFNNLHRIQKVLIIFPDTCFQQ